MSTRSTIGYIENGKDKRIYCHYNGDLKHTGKMLLNSWNTADKVKQLVNFGSISALEKYPNVIVVSHAPKDQREHTYLMNVKHEENDINPEDAELYVNPSEEYNYTWKNGQWYVQFYDRAGDNLDLLLSIALVGFSGHKTNVPKKFASKYAYLKDAYKRML